MIDEVQKIPEILSVVHSLIEEKRGCQFVLTGSSARKLKRSGVDLLAGRALLKHMSPFFAGELGERFQLHQALRLGLVPLIVLAEHSECTPLLIYRGAVRLLRDGVLIIPCEEFLLQIHPDKNVLYGA